MGQSIESNSISVIIPAFNAEKTIERALDSVRLQSSPELILEVLVIDDGSTDQTAKIVNNFQEKYNDFPLRLISKINGGVSTARNRGMEEAQGKWLALLDSDDEWSLNKLEVQANIINENSEIEFLGANHTDKPLKILGKVIKDLYKPNIKELCIKTFPQTSTAIFKRKIFEEIGGYDESRRYCEDAQFFNKICINYGFYFIPNQLSIYDGGKRGFGVSGLSGNIKAMQEGVRANMKELRQQKNISLIFYLFITCYNEMKYLRRILIMKWKR
ncbi:glycosyltransferase family 2 protein [Streptococcus uberis]|uniref:glycosyltransferase family 2 protein n=1 Tax=Streptococcus uberis TaxID=1349 RepID=UPI0012B668BB|nr:glycosyltransferase [Streptococcus uberis]MTB61755.1 glycosyltransferase [Streptococcus uberis]MTB91725.1 glycosyltransferase [Streptococcus uberis]